MSSSIKKQFFQTFFAALLAIFSVLMSSDALANQSNSGGVFGSNSVDQQIEGIIKYPIQVDGEELEYAHLWFKQILGGFIFAPWEELGIDNGAFDKDDVTVQIGSAHV